MPEPTLQDVHLDAALTDFSVAYFQDPMGYVAQRVFPITPVAQKSNSYYVYDKASALRSEAEKRSPGTESAVRSYTLSRDTYNCDVYSIAVDVSEQIRANADPALDPEEDAARQTVQDIKIRMDQDFAAAAFSTGIWATESSATWNTSTGDPIGDIATAVKTVLANTGFRPNTLVLGADSWYSGLWNNSAITARLADNAPRIVDPSFIGQLFGFSNVYIAQSVRNTAQEDSTGDPTMAFNLGDHALVAYVDPNPGLRTPTAGRTFVWTGLVGASDGIRTKRLEMPWRDAMPRVETDTAFDFKVTAADLGYLIKDTVS